MIERFGRRKGGGSCKNSVVSVLIVACCYFVSFFQILDLQKHDQNDNIVQGKEQLHEEKITFQFNDDYPSESPAIERENYYFDKSQVYIY